MYISHRHRQGLLAELSNVYDVSVTAVGSDLYTVVFNDPVGDVPGLQVRALSTLLS